MLIIALYYGFFVNFMLLYFMWPPAKTRKHEKKPGGYSANTDKISGGNAMISALQNMDWAVLHWIHNTFSCGFLDFVLPRITAVCNHGEIWIITAVILLCTKKYRKYGVFLAVGLLLGLLIGNLWLKPWVARMRPCWLEPGITLLVPNLTDFSFPSGHSLSSAIAVTILCFANKKFALWAVPLGLIIAFSRLYLMVHFPTDVAAGILLGVVIGCLTVYCGRKITERFAKATAQQQTKIN